MRAAGHGYGRRIRSEGNCATSQLLETGSLLASVCGLAALTIAMLSPCNAQERSVAGWRGTQVVSAGVTATDLRISTQNQITRLVLTLSTSARVSVFTLADPYRLILDLPQTLFNLDPLKSQASRGIVRDFRFGLLAPGKSRLVVDTTTPFKLVDVRALSLADGSSEIHLDLGTVSPRAFRPQGVPPQVPKARALRQGLYETGGKPPGTGKASVRNRRPVVVVDPGHGGPDSGAVGHRGILEKTVALAVSRRLASALEATRRYKVVMTRSRDEFVSLEDRVAISQKVGSDLFISLHADAIPQRNLVASVRGATVYTLSQRASDRQSQEFAEKENSSDALAGLRIANSAARGRIEAILFDLMRRETSNFTQRLREHLVRRLKRTISMAREPHRAAAFRVLQQPETPSVLIELGYMSNAADVREMTKLRWQRRAARAIVAAINAYFDDRKR